jgi:hypothetical protein
MCNTRCWCISAISAYILWCADGVHGGFAAGRAIRNTLLVLTVFSRGKREEPMRWLMVGIATAFVFSVATGCSGGAGRKAVDQDADTTGNDVGPSDIRARVDLTSEGVWPDLTLTDTIEDTTVDLPGETEDGMPGDEVDELWQDIYFDFIEEVQLEVTTLCCADSGECPAGYRCEESIGACLPQPFEGQCWHDLDCLSPATCVGSYLCECAGPDNYSCGDCLAECDGPDTMGMCMDAIGMGCCMVAADCDWLDGDYKCVGHDLGYVPGWGVCMEAPSWTAPEAPEDKWCWDSFECVNGEYCHGAGICGCGIDCDMDYEGPGICVASGQQCVAVESDWVLEYCDFANLIVFDGEKCVETLPGYCWCGPFCDFTYGSIADCEETCGISSPCLQQGELIDPLNESPQCCVGLSPLPQWQQGPGACDEGDVFDCCYSCFATAFPDEVCAACGDGWCTAGENVCNCPVDCFCNPDVDSDGIFNLMDNCPTLPNPSVGDIDSDGLGDDCDLDNDNDGSHNLVDCNQFNALIYPGSEEVCNAVDDDCDGELNEGFPACGVLCDEDGEDWDNCPNICNSSQDDFDGDGMGDACDPDIDNDGYPNDMDCAVYESSVFPGAAEICDGVDNNCDGMLDAGCPCIEELTPFLSNAPVLECCPGLIPIPACSVESSYECSGAECDFYCKCQEALLFVCAPCGNGQCDPGESVCNCQDCLL